MRTDEVITKVPRSHSAVLGSLAAIAILATAAGADAQDNPSRAARAYVVGQLGLFGDARLQNDGRSYSDGLEPSGGGAIGLELPVIPILSLGVEAGAWGWNTDGGDDIDVGPSLLVDLNVVPRLRIPWSNGSAHGAVTFGVPVGATISALNGEVNDSLGVFGTKVKTGFGANVGGMLGLQVFPVRAIGVIVEAGYVHHFVWHDVDGPLGSDAQIRLDLGQLVVRAGLGFAF